MAGTYAIGEKKTRPGVYHRRENAGGVPGAGAVNGIGAGVIRANWGPLNEVLTFEPSTDVKKVYGYGLSQDLITEMFNGGISSGAFIRAGNGGTAPSIVLQGDSGEAGSIQGKYVGDRAFTITIRDSLSGEQRECIIYDGETEFVKVSYTSGESEIHALKAALEAATNDFVVLPQQSATGKLQDIMQNPFVAGTNPKVTTEDYSNAFSLLEPVTFNVLCVDTEDTAVHLLLAAFLNRIYMDGAYPMGCVAGKSDIPLKDRMTNAAALNDEKMHYVLNSAIDASNSRYEGYKLAARIGGMIAAVPSNQSLTHTVVSGFTDLAENLTNSQVEAALKKGCIVLTKNSNGQVWIEQGINTLITPNADQDEGWKKIRRVKTRFELMQRVDDTIAPLIGKVNNDTNGRATVMAAGQGIINTMIGEGKLLDGSLMLEDSANPPQGDSAWFVFVIYDVDSVEKVYLTYRFRYSV